MKPDTSSHGEEKKKKAYDQSEKTEEMYFGRIFSPIK